MRDPQVFLFDEPLSNLDAKLRIQMRTEIKELHQRLRTTTVFVTNDQIGGMTLADRIFVMRDGRMEQIGMPLGLCHNPANAFVVTFIGAPSMNLLRADLGAGQLRIANQVFDGLAGRGNVHLGVRPEHLILADQGLTMEVKGVEPTGSETMVFLKFEGQDITTVSRTSRV